MFKAARLKNIIFCNRFYDYNEYRLKSFVERIASSIQAGKILDAGAGQLQYKKYFSHLEYVSQDLGIGDKSWDFSKVDIISEIYEIPLEAESFDHVLCIQVLEHLKYPNSAFREFARLLKPGGQLFVTCPLTWKEHQKPHDFFRYTQNALRMLAEDNNFKVKEISKVGGKFITIARLMNDLNLIIKIKNKILIRSAIVLTYPFAFTLGFICYFLDKLDKDKDLTLQYECVFEKC